MVRRRILFSVNFSLDISACKALIKRTEVNDEMLKKL